MMMKNTTKLKTKALLHTSTFSKGLLRSFAYKIRVTNFAWVARDVESEFPQSDKAWESYPKLSPSPNI